jgi:hypothetical protein
MRSVFTYWEHDHLDGDLLAHGCGASFIIGGVK